ncbi:MAG: permease [Candidatus Lokiarchaeota archaeon]|nr:permease [Candidatus Lokiarchaeota archaeon]
MVWGKVQMFMAPVSKTPVDYAVYEWYLIPIVYIVDYFKSAGISLAFAFLLSGIIQEFMPPNTITKYLGSSRKRSYVYAALLAPVFITCSCSVIPIYGALLAVGAGVGVSMTFLLMAPAANFLTLFITGDYLGWDLVLLRYVFSFAAAICCGMLFARTRTAKEIEANTARAIAAKSVKSLEDKDIHARVLNWARATWGMTKKVLPYLLIGLVVVSYIAAYLPEEWIHASLTGLGGILVGAALGGPLYTPALVEIVLTKSLIDAGMSRSSALSFMMGQPYDIVSWPPNSKFFRWKGVAIYTAVFFAFSVLAGLFYGLALGEL